MEAGFLEVIEYPEWLANIVPVPKKDGKVRMCMDYRDLNRANLKDDFSLPHIDVLLDSTGEGGGVMCFSPLWMVFLGIIRLQSTKDKGNTSFCMPWRTSCYTIMSFGLKKRKGNVSESYDSLIS